MHIPDDWKVNGVHPPLKGHDSCGCPPLVVAVDSGARIAEIACGWPKEESDRLAKLIAAAPKMLAALEALTQTPSSPIGDCPADISSNPCVCGFHDALSNARAAIKDATGGSKA